jgi:hypothetical protein
MSCCCFLYPTPHAPVSFLLHCCNALCAAVSGNGTRYRVLTRSADTAGASYSVEVLCRSSVAGFSSELPCSLPGHVHLSQDERVSVAAGRLGWIKGRERGLLQAGEELLIDKGERCCSAYGCEVLRLRLQDCRMHWQMHVQAGLAGCCCDRKCGARLLLASTTTNGLRQTQDTLQPAISCC